MYREGRRDYDERVEVKKLKVKNAKLKITINNLKIF
jgi:hypothetical protein